MNIGDLSIRAKIPQIEVAIGDQDCVLAIRVLEPPAEADLQRLSQFAQEYNINLYLQTKGPDTIVPLPGRQPVLPHYALPEHDIEFQFKPAMFTQVNYEINRKMINRVLETLDLNKQDTVLDLFCGLGNFTLPMAKKVGYVVGIEGDLPLVIHARSNAQKNGIENVEFHVADLTKPIEAPWAKQSYSKILLDPSRAGALQWIYPENFQSF